MTPRKEQLFYQSGHGFYATKEGKQAWREFHQTEIFRADPTRPLTAYFDPTAYGLRVVAKNKHAA